MPTHLFALYIWRSCHLCKPLTCPQSYFRRLFFYHSLVCHSITLKDKRYDLVMIFSLILHKGYPAMVKRIHWYLSIDVLYMLVKVLYPVVAVQFWGLSNDLRILLSRMCTNSRFLLYFVLRNLHCTFLSSRNEASMTYDGYELQIEYASLPFHRNREEEFVIPYFGGGLEDVEYLHVVWLLLQGSIIVSLRDCRGKSFFIHYYLLKRAYCKLFLILKILSTKNLDFVGMPSYTHY